MRISEITNWAYGITVALTVLAGASFILSAQSAEEERRAVEQHLAFASLSKDLTLGAEESTDEARLYVMRGDQRHLDAFRGKAEEERRRERAIKDIRAAGASVEELAALEDVDRNAEALDRLEQAAIASYMSGDQPSAQRVLFGPDHERLQTALLNGAQRFEALATARTTDAVVNAKWRSDWLSIVAKTMLGLTAALFLSVLYFILRRRVAIPLIQMTGIVTRLAKQDYAVEVPVDRRRDEIGDMNEAIQVFRINGIERDRLDAERRQDQETKDLILQMMHRLQACQTQVELADIVSRFAPQIFPGLCGRLYVLNDSRTGLSEIGTWLSPRQSAVSFSASACWGLRRGRLHVSNGSHGDIPCQHLHEHDAASLCVPLMAQGDTIGLLYFEERSGHEMVAEASRLYLELIAENIGLAVANLQLRDKLTNLAVRDALTGLFNRRCLDEALNRTAKDEANRPVACLMIDIDHFKRFNDDHGHDAGDVVIQYVAQFITDAVGTAGTAYRFGGEEFTIILPGFTEIAGVEFAERLRNRIGAAPLAYRSRVLGSITVSIGVGSAPEAGSVGTLLTRADLALLSAKACGRNMTVSASSLPPTLPARRRG